MIASNTSKLSDSSTYPTPPFPSTTPESPPKEPEKYKLPVLYLMSSRVLLRSSRHPASGTVSALPLKSSVSQTLVHRLLHSPGPGATPPSAHFQNSFLFASSGDGRRAFSSMAGKRDSKRKDDDVGGGRGCYEEHESPSSSPRESGSPSTDSKKRKNNTETPVRRPSTAMKGFPLSSHLSAPG